MAYKGASERNQKRLDRFKMVDIGPTKEALSLEQQADVLNKRKRHLMDLLADMKDKREEYGREMLEIQNELSRIGKQKAPRPREYNFVLMEIVKEEVTHVQWELWKKKADERMQELSKLMEVGE